MAVTITTKRYPLQRCIASVLGIQHITIDLDFMHQYFKSSLLEGAEKIPEGHYASDNMKSTVVPFRNGIMLSIAIGIAESNGLKKVFIANHGGDHTIILIVGMNSLKQWIKLHKQVHL